MITFLNLSKLILAVHREKQRLDLLFKKIKDVEGTELKAQWARYLCVLTSGFIENSVRNILNDFANNKAAPPIANYVKKKINRVTNLQNNNIISLLDSFNTKWTDKYRENVNDEGVAALDGVVATRHQIAHGKNTGITYASISDYYRRVCVVIQLIEDIVNDRI